MDCYFSRPYFYVVLHFNTQKINRQRLRLPRSSMISTQINSPLREAMELGEPDNKFIASKTPIEDLKSLAYAGQNPNHQLYRAGYEEYFNLMPKMSDHDPFMVLKRNEMVTIFKALKAHILKDGWWKDIPLTPGDFVSRVILAMEKPYIGENGQLYGGAEILVTRWAKGITLPIHSHAAGYMHEEMLQGKWTETEYRVAIDDRERKVKTVTPISTETFVTGDIISDTYTNQDPNNKYPALIHSAVVEEETFAIHFIPSHPRDARDNVGYVLEYTQPYEKPMENDSDY